MNRIKEKNMLRKRHDTWDQIWKNLIDKTSLRSIEEGGGRAVKRIKKLNLQYELLDLKVENKISKKFI